MSTLAKAIATAMHYHHLQVDKSGHPYVGHVLRTLGYAATETQNEAILCAAVLHDIIEDTDCTYQDLQDLGFSVEVINLVRAVTHAPPDTYADYIEKIPLIGGMDAITVKLADLEDNLDGRRGDFPNRESVDARHVKARVRLLEIRDATTPTQG